MSLRRTHEFPVARAHTGTGYVITTLRLGKQSLEDYGTYVAMGPGVQTDSASQDDRQWRGVEIRVVAPASAEGEDGELRVYRATPYAGSRATGGKGDCALDLIGFLTYTIGTGAGQASAGTPDQIDSATRFASVMAWTPLTGATSPAGITDLIEAIYSPGVTPTVFSPTGAGCAILAIPDVGNGDIFIDWADVNLARALVSLRV